MEEKEDEFFFKLDQEIYKLQHKLKTKIASIEPERQSVLKRIEEIVKETYSTCKSDLFI